MKQLLDISRKPKAAVLMVTLYMSVWRADYRRNEAIVRLLLAGQVPGRVHYS